MDDDGFADPPTEWTGSDRGDKRGRGCLLIVAVNAVLWSIVFLMVKSCVS